MKLLHLELMSALQKLPIAFFFFAFLLLNLMFS